jgi:ABC-type sulfate transport system permease component
MIFTVRIPKAAIAVTLVIAGVAAVATVCAAVWTAFGVAKADPSQGGKSRSRIEPLP